MTVDQGAELAAEVELDEPEQPSDVAELVRALQLRPGRGGIRLSHAQGELALRLLAGYGIAIRRELRSRRMVAPSAAELVRVLDGAP